MSNILRLIGEAPVLEEAHRKLGADPEVDMPEAFQPDPFYGWLASLVFTCSSTAPVERFVSQNGHAGPLRAEVRCDVGPRAEAWSLRIDS